MPGGVLPPICRALLDQRRDIGLLVEPDGGNTIGKFFCNPDDGFIVGHDWMKSALLEKNAIVKSYHEETAEPIITQLQQLPEPELARILADDDVEITEVLEREVLDGVEIGLLMKGEALPPVPEPAPSKKVAEPSPDPEDEAVPELPGLAASLRNPKLVPES